MGAGIARASMGDVDEAIALFQRAVDLDPRNPQAQQNLARALALRK
jgi:Flp pilus assembly protein TadD